MRRPSDARRCIEGVEALFASRLLIGKRPAQAEERADHEAENLKKIGGVCRSRVQRESDIRAEQKREQQHQGALEGEEGLSLDPVEVVIGGALFQMAPRGRSKRDKEHEWSGAEYASQMLGQVGIQGNAAAGQRQGNQQGQHTKAEQ